MIKPFRTVKMRIIALMLCFVLLITMVVVVFSVNLMGNFRTETVKQSAEFNLQLVASAIERDLVELVALANWCSFGTNAPARYLISEYTPGGAMQAFNRLQEEVRNSRVSRYVDRIMVADWAVTRALHTGTNTSNVRSFTKEGLSVLDRFTLGTGAMLYDITADPFSRTQSYVINILAPVYSPIDYTAIGTVYLAASVSVITDNLRGYALNDGAGLYLTLGDHRYRLLEGGRILSVSEAETITAAADGMPLNAIACPVRDGVTLTHVFANEPPLSSWGEWLDVLLPILGLILVLAVIAIAVLNMLISRPVVRIRKKVDEIAMGDFSYAPEIESDSEIGAVGRGINRLSRNVVELMESRVADEKQQRELEYRMLQSQVNPHFLYNTLGAIKWMATLQKAEGIAEMTTALSRLLKTVAKDVRKVVPLRDELALLDDYFLIMKYRYGSAIDFERQVAGDHLLDSMLPRFVLQPLMENAIFHGIEPKGNGRIVLSVTQDGADVLIALQDDGVGMDESRIAALLSGEAKGGSLGLRTVHARIQNVFGERYGLRIESEVGLYTRMTLRIPQGKEDTPL